MCISKAIFEEYTEVLQRDRFKKYQGFENASIILLEQIKKNALWFEPKLTIDVIEDKDDNKFIELAVESWAAYIVTGNSNDFTIKFYNDTVICSPREFYESKVSSWLKLNMRPYRKHIYRPSVFVVSRVNNKLIIGA